MGGGDFSVDLYDTEKWTRRYGIRPLSLSLHALTSAGLDHLLRWRPDGPVPFVQVARFRRFLIVIACFALCPLMPRPLLDDAFALTRSDDARDEAERTRVASELNDQISSGARARDVPARPRRRRRRPLRAVGRRGRARARLVDGARAARRAAARRGVPALGGRSAGTPPRKAPVLATARQRAPVPPRCWSAAAGRNDPCADTSAHARVSSQPVATVHRTPALVLRGGGAS